MYYILQKEQIKHVIMPYQSRALLVTSSLFFIPVYIAYKRSHHFYMVTSFGTGLCSILYWYNPIHCWRRSLDLFYAKYTFLVYVNSGIFFLPKDKQFLFYIGVLLLVTFYIMSISYPDKWLIYHLIFHIVSIATISHIVNFAEFCGTINEVSAAHFITPSRGGAAAATAP